MRSSGPGGAERQQALDCRSAALRRAPLAVAPERRGDPPDAPLAAKRLTAWTHACWVILVAQSHRTQERNRADALERLVALIQEAAVRPTPRRATKPTRASKEKRLEGKKVRSAIKGMRRTKPGLGPSYCGCRRRAPRRRRGVIERRYSSVSMRLVRRIGLRNLAWLLGVACASFAALCLVLFRLRRDSRPRRARKRRCALRSIKWSPMADKAVRACSSVRASTCGAASPSTSTGNTS